MTSGSVTLSPFGLDPVVHGCTWLKLERVLLVVFKKVYGQVPKCNQQDMRTHRGNMFEFFRESRVRRVIEDLS